MRSAFSLYGVLEKVVGNLRLHMVCADCPLAPEETQQQSQDADAPSLAVDTIELLSAVLQHSPANRRSMQNINGDMPC